MPRRKKNNTTLLVYITIGIFGSLIVCCTGVLAVSLLSGSTISGTSAPVSLPSLAPLDVIIAQTSSAAQAQTAQAIPSTPLPTATNVASIEIVPTATIFIFQLQTDVAQPTEYSYSTNTPFSLVTQSIEATSQPTQLIQATQSSQSEVCSCSVDYNCPDFPSQVAAQNCFDYCKSTGHGDIHGLDKDEDNLACETTKY